MEVDPAAWKGFAPMLAAASEVARLHVSDADGWCVGCLAAWGRLVSVEQCTQLQWAAAVQARYGTGRPSAPS